MRVMVIFPEEAPTSAEAMKQSHERVKAAQELYKFDVSVRFYIPNEKSQEVLGEVGDAIRELPYVDAVVFMDGWRESRPCLFLHMVATEYRFKRLYEQHPLSQLR